MDQIQGSVHLGYRIPEEKLAELAALSSWIRPEAARVGIRVGYAMTEIKVIDVFELIEISGAPFARGQSYGEQAAEKIRQSIEYYRQLFVQTRGLSWSEITARAQRWVPVISATSAELLQEMDGIAKGAGVDLLDVIVLNARGEIAYDRTFGEISTTPERGATTADRECSSFSLTDMGAGDGHIYCGQNWDWHAFAQDTVIILRVVAPPQPTIITIVEAGQLGRHGVNSAGVALNANGLGGRFGDEIGVPQTVIRRLILSCDGIKDALEVPLNLRQQIAANLLFTHKSGVSIDLETTPGRHNWLYPVDGVMAHTNHYIGPIPEQLAQSYRPYSSDTLYRLPRLRAGLCRSSEVSSSDEVRDTIEAALTDHVGFPHSVCNHPDDAEPTLLQDKTIMSQIVDLTSGEYFVASGNPCVEKYVKLPWNIYEA